MTGTPGIRLRQYEDRDEPAVLDLLRAALGEGPTGARSSLFFKWKHFDNPFGRSYLLLAEADEGVVGLRAFMRWRFSVGDRTVDAVRAVDTATHPDYQGRGIFSTLTRRGLGDVNAFASFVFNTPNDKSMPGYLKMGWEQVSPIAVDVSIRRPLRFALRGANLPPRSAPEIPPVAAPAATVLREETRLPSLLARARSASAGWATDRSADYLRWRYADAPQLEYRVVRIEDGSRLQGLGVFRMRLRQRLVEASVVETLVEGSDPELARRLMSKISGVAKADHLTSYSSSLFPRRSPLPSIRRRNAMTLVVNVLKDVDPDPRGSAAWNLDLGDLEVF